MSRTFLDMTNSKPCGFCGNAFYRDTRNTYAYWAKAKYCSRECAGGSWSIKSEKCRPSMAEAFFAQVSKSDGCWEWTGIKDKDGYGLFPYATVQHRANRIALELDGRPVAKGHYACHRCDNPGCVRPDHLYPGTPKQNSDDAVKRDRTIRGERSHSAKLTEAAVREIRASKETDASLGQKYGVSHSNISMVRSGRTWGHVR